MASSRPGQGLGAVLTNAVRYAERRDAVTVDVLDAARRLVALDLRHLERRNAEGYLKSGKEMHEVADEVARPPAGWRERGAPRDLLAAHPHRSPTAARSTRAPTSAWARSTSRSSTPLERPDAGDPDVALRARCEAAVGRPLRHRPRASASGSASTTSSS